MTHATPIIAEIHGERQVIFFTQKGLVSCNTKSGDVLWRAPPVQDFIRRLTSSKVISFIAPPDTVLELRLIVSAKMAANIPQANLA